MPLRIDLQPRLDIDQILRNQGADPNVVRLRSPRLLEAAGQALAIGQPLIEPVVAYRELRVKSVQHERLVLAEGGQLSGKTVLRLLAPARQVILMVCTIGPALEDLAAGVLHNDPALGMALDALGSSAVEALTVAACSFFGEQAKQRGWGATLPLSPGMDGWPADRGQRQIFDLLPPEEAGVQLTSSGMMIPQKSLSLVIGVGPDVEEGGRVCDYCTMRYSCRHQEHYV